MSIIKTIKRNKSVLAFSLLLSTLSVNSQSATFNVNDYGDAGDITPGNGICETSTGNAVCTLRAAIGETNALAGADTINLPSGTYTIQSNAAYSNSSGSFFITGELNLIGENASTTIIDANQRDRAMVIQASGNVAISNITIENGNVGASGVGGGILLGGNSLTASISDVVIRNNSANTGAGIAWGSPVNSVTIENSLIENNNGITEPNSPSSTGGGISSSTGSLYIINSNIQNNSSNFGGGISTIGNVALLNSTISGNTADVPQNMNSGYGGGGIHVGSGSDGTFISINSTISGNKSHNSGAGILVVKGSAFLYNTTVTGNIADFSNDGFGVGGGITGSDSLPKPSIYLTNSIIADNTSNSGDGSDCWGFNLGITSYGYNIIGNSSDCTITQSTGDMFGTSTSIIDPLLDVLADNGGNTLTHALKPGSPAIDAGNPSDCLDNIGARLTSDQRGINRHIDGGSGSARCDIGAYEMNYILSANAGADQSAGINDEITLDASNTQSSRGIASYSWTQIAGTSVTLLNSSTDSPSFTAPATPTTLSFELTVTDINGATATDTVNISIADNTTTTTTNNTGGGGGAFDLLLGILSAIFVLFLRQAHKTRSGCRN
ncbi:MAG TPA: choice-of-anchor Q domain-containing protein [Gammaproteobacteria bacterium]